MATRCRGGENVSERGSESKGLALFNFFMRLFMLLCEGWRDAGAGETGRVG